MLTSDGVHVLLLTAQGQLLFANLATNTTLWSPVRVTAQPAAAERHALQLTADGELQLVTGGLVVWKAGTAGRAQGPVRLTAMGQDLALSELATGRVLWLAPVACDGVELLPYDQCGGLAPSKDPSVRLMMALADAPYASSCCPAGFSCTRRSSEQWRCQPSGVLQAVCTGPKALPAGAPCGGISLCGKDGTCSSSCCLSGSYCQRVSAYTWSCAASGTFKGGLLS